MGPFAGKGSSVAGRLRNSPSLLCGVFRRLGFSRRPVRLAIFAGFPFFFFLARGAFGFTVVAFA